MRGWVMVVLIVKMPITISVASVIQNYKYDDDCNATLDQNDRENDNGLSGDDLTYDDIIFMMRVFMVLVLGTLARRRRRRRTRTFWITGRSQTLSPPSSTAQGASENSGNFMDKGILG